MIDTQDQLTAAWQSGLPLQYFQTTGYDSEWTAYTNTQLPDMQEQRLVWRVAQGEIK